MFVWPTQQPTNKLKPNYDLNLYCRQSAKFIVTIFAADVVSYVGCQQQQRHSRGSSGFTVDSDVVGVGVGVGIGIGFDEVMLLTSISLFVVSGTKTTN